MMIVDHIFWDWNGTLFDDIDLSVSVANRLLEQRGHRLIDAVTYRDLFGFPVRAYYEQLGFDFAREEWTDVAREFIEHYERRRNEGKLCENVCTVLRAMQELGVQQSILSAYPHAQLEELVTALGLHPYFRYLSGLDDHYAESKIAIGRRLLATVNVSPDRVLVVGDTVHDHEVACALGTRCVLIAGGHNSSNRLRRCAVPVLPSLTSLVAFIRAGGELSADEITCSGVPLSGG